MTTMVIWDCAVTLGLSEEESIEEIQLSSVNITTISKGPVIDDRSILPKIKKIQESIKKINTNTQTTPKFDLINKNDEVSPVSEHVKIVENKTESSKNGLVDHDMGMT